MAGGQKNLIVGGAQRICWFLRCLWFQGNCDFPSLADGLSAVGFNSLKFPIYWAITGFDFLRKTSDKYEARSEFDDKSVDV